MFSYIYTIFAFPQSGNRVTLQTTALENTSIKVGPARKVSCKAKMARRSKKSKRKDGQDRCACIDTMQNIMRLSEGFLLLKAFS